MMQLLTCSYSISEHLSPLFQTNHCPFEPLQNCPKCFTYVWKYAAVEGTKPQRWLPSSTVADTPCLLRIPYILHMPRRICPLNVDHVIPPWNYYRSYTYVYGRGIIVLYADRTSHQIVEVIWCHMMSYDVIEAHCCVVDIRGTDHEQIDSRINSNWCWTFRPRRLLSTVSRSWQKPTRSCDN